VTEFLGLQTQCSLSEEQTYEILCGSFIQYIFTLHNAGQDLDVNTDPLKM
jgi:hypothetical protein